MLDFFHQALQKCFTFCGGQQQPRERQSELLSRQKRGESRIEKGSGIHNFATRSKGGVEKREVEKEAGIRSNQDLSFSFPMGFRQFLAQADTSPCTSPSSALLPFLGEGSPTKIDNRKRTRVPLFQPLKSGGPSLVKVGHLRYPLQASHKRYPLF